MYSPKVRRGSSQTYGSKRRPGSRWAKPAPEDLAGTFIVVPPIRGYTLKKKP
jgi:hypothetical protein